MGVTQAEGEPHRGTTESDASGHFFMDNAPASGTYFLEEDHHAHRLISPVRVVLREDSWALVQMQKLPAEELGSVSGSVRDRSGRTISGANVSLNGRDPKIEHMLNVVQRIRSDQEGRFSFPKIRHGCYVLIARAEGFANPIDKEGLKGLSVDPSTERRVDLVLSAHTPVEGIVLGEEGAPLAQAAVLVQFETGADSGVFTPAEGTFQIKDVAPGKHKLRVCHREYLSHESALVTITLQRGLSFSGLFLDQGGDPIEAFTLRFLDANPGANGATDPCAFVGRVGGVKKAGFTVVDGRFDVSGLLRQEYLIEVELASKETFQTRLDLQESTEGTLVLNRSDPDSPLQMRKSW